MLEVCGTGVLAQFPTLDISTSDPQSQYQICNKNTNTRTPITTTSSNVITKTSIVQVLPCKKYSNTNISTETINCALTLACNVSTPVQRLEDNADDNTNQPSPYQVQQYISKNTSTIKSSLRNHKYDYRNTTNSNIKVEHKGLRYNSAHGTFPRSKDFSTLQ